MIKSRTEKLEAGSVGWFTWIESFSWFVNAFQTPLGRPVGSAGKRLGSGFFHPNIPNL